MSDTPIVIHDATEDALDALRVRVKELEQACDAWQGCLLMVRETLEGLLGAEAMEKTPPMMYPEAILSAVKRAGAPARAGLSTVAYDASCTTAGQLRAKARKILEGL